jgi:hypothetical protein
MADGAPPLPDNVLGDVFQDAVGGAHAPHPGAGLTPGPPAAAPPPPPAQVVQPPAAPPGAPGPAAAGQGPSPGAPTGVALLDVVRYLQAAATLPAHPVAAPNFDALWLATPAPNSTTAARAAMVSVAPQVTTARMAAALSGSSAALQQHFLGAVHAVVGQIGDTAPIVDLYNTVLQTLRSAGEPALRALPSGTGVAAALGAAPGLCGASGSGSGASSSSSSTRTTVIVLGVVAGLAVVLVIVFGALWGNARKGASDGTLALAGPPPAAGGRYFAGYGAGAGPPMAAASHGYAARPTTSSFPSLLGGRGGGGGGGGGGPFGDL